jgi:DNA polymerase-3 subunit alpha
MKAIHPVEFMAALLSNEVNNTDKITVFVAECHRMGIEILPPNLNKSQLRFIPEVIESGKMAIRYGLAAIKNVGEAAMKTAIYERLAHGEYKSLEDFSSRLDSKVINKRILENLVKAGALDWTGENRATMFSRLEQVVASASASQRDKASGQSSLFDAVDFTPAPAAKDSPIINTVEEWSKDDRLAHEKELLGFYVTGHPLDKYRGILDSDKFNRIGLIDEIELENPRERYPIAGMIRTVESRMTKAGKPFGILTVEDFTGSCEVMLWSESFVPVAIHQRTLRKSIIISRVIRAQRLSLSISKTLQENAFPSNLQKSTTSNAPKNSCVPLIGLLRNKFIPLSASSTPHPATHTTQLICIDSSLPNHKARF